MSCAGTTPHADRRGELVEDLPADHPGEEMAQLITSHQRTCNALKERVKELGCLYGITRLAQREDLSALKLAQGVAEELRRSWQYPELACARVLSEGCEHRTPGYQETPWAQSARVMVEGEEVGLVEVRYLEQCPPSDEGPFLAEERHLIDAVAELLGQIIRARRAGERLRRLSRELIKAREAERQRIARELHDKTAQDLSLLKIGIEELLGRPGQPPGPGESHVRRLVDMAAGIISEVRGLSYALMPPELEQLGLATAASRLCFRFGDEQGLDVDFSCEGLDALGMDFEAQINLYRIVQEALTNIRRHAGATRVRVLLVATHPSLILRVEDDGTGFDPSARPTEDGEHARMGLLSMRERARLLGGTFGLRSRPGGGTRIKVEIPVPGEGNA